MATTTARAALPSFVSVVVAAILFIDAPSASASNWPTSVAAASKGLAQADIIAAPTSVNAVCVGGLTGKITVSWAASPHATSYTIYVATAASTGPYSVIATGVSASPWTSNTLGTSNYWFQVVANVGTNWISANSAASPQRGILLSLLCG